MLKVCIAGGQESNNPPFIDVELDSSNSFNCELLLDIIFWLISFYRLTEFANFDAFLDDTILLAIFFVLQYKKMLVREDI